jgi:hypothetical protein
MASYGAKNLMFLSRSAGKSEENQTFFKDLNLMGCSTQSFSCDISDRDSVTIAITQAYLPIAGVMQMAMVLRDVGVLSMDLDSWNAATRPKIQGTWNLHNILPKDMDFFVLSSSVGGTFGYYGQSNYASANTFLDSFAQYRQGLGQAASVVNIGPVDDVGYDSRTSATRETLLQTLETLLTEQNLLDLMRFPSTPIPPINGFTDSRQTTAKRIFIYCSLLQVIRAFSAKFRKIATPRSERCFHMPFRKRL